MIYLLDTNIMSEPVKPIPNANVLAKLAQHQGELAICTVAITELFIGIYSLPDSNRRMKYEEHLKRAISVMPVLDYDLRAAMWFAKECARLTRLGRKPTFNDGQIAGVAAANNLILVTRNVKHFTQFNGLQVENWFEV